MPEEPGFEGVASITSGIAPASLGQLPPQRLGGASVQPELRAASATGDFLGELLVPRGGAFRGGMGAGVEADGVG